MIDPWEDDGQEWKGMSFTVQSTDSAETVYQSLLDGKGEGFSGNRVSELVGWELA
jgi:hypothetical protein